MTSEALDKYEVTARSARWSARKKILLIIAGFVILAALATLAFFMFDGDAIEEKTGVVNQDEDTEEVKNTEEVEDPDDWDEHDEEDFDPEEDEDDYDY